MIEQIKRNLTSESIAWRIITAYLCFLVIFNILTIISYYLLPQGILLGKHPLQNWDTSPSLIVSSLQIFSYNLMSAVVILAGNLFSSRKNKAKSYMPFGYLAFFVMISINAVVLGTWSFSVVTDPVPLVDRLLRTFDLLHRAGLWEMSGQLFILCSTVNISLIITDGKETIIKSWKTIRLSKKEKFVFVIGLTMILLGAIIESYAILQFIL
ncbi:MAG: hypothetical protein AAGU75_07900 [Bacillota bacterium]